MEKKKLNIEYMDIEKLIPYINNPRDNRDAVDMVASSIKEFGFKNPIIVDEGNVIVAGHTRLLAGRKLGLNEVPVIKVSDLSDSQIKAFRIADNRTSEFSEWDMDLLKIEIEGIDDLFTGFDASDLFGDEDKQEEVEAEIPFSDELLEEHQYIVMYFDSSMDWEVAKEMFGISTVKTADSTEKYHRAGIGRVIRGNDVIEMVQRGEDL